MVVVMPEGQESPVLTEVPADSELQLQERLKEHPELIPVDEFGLAGPMLVVGRETSVASGAADLIGVDQRGEIIVVEFKTGPQNPDFRAAFAQLMDYGAQLWKLPYASFDALVVGYFQGKHCPVDAPSIGCGSLKGAAEKTWASAWNDVDRDEFIARVEANLAAGTFHYVVVAQRFTAPMERVANYLNAIGTGRAHFHLVEMIRFSDGTVEAFEARTLVTSRTTTGGRGSASLDQETFLARVSDESF